MKKRRGINIAFILVFIISINYLICGFTIQNNKSIATEKYTIVNAKVIKAINGEVLRVEINGKPRDIQLKGITIPKNLINTKAYDEVKKLEGKTVQIKYNQSDVNKYGKLLVWMYVKHTLFGGSLILSGLATCVSVFYYEKSIGNDKKIEAYLKTLEQQAKKNGTGIWKESTKEIQKNINVEKVGEGISNGSQSIISEGTKIINNIIKNKE